MRSRPDGGRGRSLSGWRRMGLPIHIAAQRVAAAARKAKRPLGRRGKHRRPLTRVRKHRS